LEVGSEYRNACTRKSLSHYLHRVGFFGSGRDGDEAGAICGAEGQAVRLVTLADENLIVGIGHLVIGGSHCIASLRASGRRSPGTAIIRHLASRLKPVNALRGIENRVDRNQVDRLDAFSAESWNECPSQRQFSPNFAPALALLQHSPSDRTLECGHRL